MADLANWSDFIKSDTQWDHSHTWHYANVPDGVTYSQSTLNPKGDVVEAINRMYKDLKNKKLPLQKRKESLAFLVHFVGDIHQPLHMGRAEDRGGNATAVTWFGKKTNLHAIWDEDLVDMEKMSYTEYTDYLIRLHGKSKTKYEQSDVLVWAQESQDFRPLVYNINDIIEKKSFAYEYRFRVRDTMNLQLYKAGVRLAYILNRAMND